MYNQETFIVKKLIESRTSVLVGELLDETSRELAEQLLVMDRLSNKPIKLLINSPGGFIDSGLFLIDIILGLRSPVHTIISGEACSMAGLVSVCGSKRYITSHSVWMGHEGKYCAEDYLSKLKDRHLYYLETEKKIDTLLKEYTKLTDEDLDKTHRGELWCNPQQCLEKGIVDEILGLPKNNARSHTRRTG
jgi:ATP-dependent Clp protease protease subunit